MRIWVLFLCVMMFHCAEKPERWADLQASLNHTPLRLKQVTDIFEVQVDYVPPWASIRKEISNRLAVNQADVGYYQRLLEPHLSGVQFRLTVTQNQKNPNQTTWTGGLEVGGVTTGAFTDQIHHLMFGMKDRIYLTDGSQRIPLAFYYLDRNWGLGNQTRIMLTFPSEIDGQPLIKKEKLELIVQNLIPSKGELRFDFPQNPIAFAARSAEQLVALVP